MIRLDTINRTLEIHLAGTVTTNQLPVTVSYSDKTTSTYNGNTQVSVTNDATPVTICDAPAASTVRDIDYIDVWNRDTTNKTVTIVYNDNTTLYTIVQAILFPGDQLVYTHAQGWRSIDVNGSTKTTIVNTLTNAFLDDLQDVAIATPLAGQVLTYTGAIWQNGQVDLSNANAVTGNLPFSYLATLTADRAVITDGSGVITISATTSTEVGYLSGVTSAIQTQLDAKYDEISAVTGNIATFGTSGTVLTDSGFAPGDFQPLDSDLSALAAIATTGIYVITGVGTSTTRTITGTTNEIDLTNGDGVAGDPTVSITTNPLIPGYLRLAEISNPGPASASEAWLFANNYATKTQLVFIADDGISIELAQDNYIVGRNATGSTIPKGTPVYISGVQSSNRPRVTPAQANALATSRVVGLMGEDTLDGNDARIMYTGLMESVDTSSFSEGDALYLSDSVAGGLQNTPPTFPSFLVRIGVVLTSGVNGRILVEETFIRRTLDASVVDSFTIGTTASNNIVLDVTGSSLTASRTITFQDADGTVAYLSNLAAYQPLDSDLSALAAIATTGIYVITGTGTSTTRTITGTTNEIDLTNGDGVAGDPTVSLPSTLIAPGSVQATSNFIAGTATTSFTTTNATNLTIIPGAATTVVSPGRSVSITGGPGGATSGNGGTMNITGGAPTNGNGGNTTVTGGNAVGTNRNGGFLALRGGIATGSGTAGDVALQGGQNSASGPGGQVTINGGDGPANTAAGGAVSLSGGQGHPGGAVTIFGGASTSSTLSGGAVTITGGTGSASGGGPGNVTVEGGTAFPGFAGGSVTVVGGFGGGDGGAVFITGGVTGGSTGAGGSVSISGGAATGTNQNGGNVTITATAKTGSGTDGDINLVIPATGTLNINGAAGTSGQVLTSNGPSASPTWQTTSGGASRLDQITAATGTASINNGDNAIDWNWALTTAAKSAFGITETSASTGGSGSQFLFDVGTLAASTANPIRIQAQGNNILTVTNVGVVTLQGTNTGTGSAITIRGGNSSTAATAGASATLIGGTSGTSGTGGQAIVTGGIGGTTGVGGAVTITGGAGGSASGNAGAVTITGGTPVAGTGGNFSASGSAGVGTNQAGGTASLVGGNATGTGVAGTVTITGGTAAGAGTGGSINLTAGSTTGGTNGNIVFTTVATNAQFRNGNFTTAGDAQHGVYVLRTQTTNATPTVMFLDGTGGTARLNIPQNAAWTFDILVTARNTGAAQAGGYRFVGVIRRTTTAASTTLVGSSKTTIAEDNAAWDVNISADTTNAALQIQVTGVAATTIDWVAVVETAEVHF